MKLGAVICAHPPDCPMGSACTCGRDEVEEHYLEVEVEPLPGEHVLATIGRARRLVWERACREIV